MSEYLKKTIKKQRREHILIRIGQVVLMAVAIGIIVAGTLV